MPVYIYKSMTQNGQLVRGRIEDVNKINCVKRLKRNGLTPISVTQTIRIIKPTVQKSKNKKSSIGITAQEANNLLSQKAKKKKTLIEQINSSELITGKISSKDIKVFTQNFLLLKKANFNNIHALSTVIETTENPRLKIILEDILAGVEAGEYMYLTMEYYSNIFPYIYINMIKVGELSGSLLSSLEQAVTYLESSESLNKRLKRILIPNIIQFVGMLILLIVGTLVAIPAIQKVFDEVGTKDELPWITRWFSGVVDMLVAYWYVPTTIIARNTNNCYCIYKYS